MSDISKSVEVPSKTMDCFWPRCSDHKRCEAYGSCVAKAQAGGATFTPSHQELFSAIYQHAKAIVKLTEAVPVECRTAETTAYYSPLQAECAVLAGRFCISVASFRGWPDVALMAFKLACERLGALEPNTLKAGEEQP